MLVFFYDSLSFTKYGAYKAHSCYCLFVYNGIWNGFAMHMTEFICFYEHLCFSQNIKHYNKATTDILHAFGIHGPWVSLRYIERKR
jgi:hypothetical protein